MVRTGIGGRLRRQARLLGVAFQQVAPLSPPPAPTGWGWGMRKCSHRLKGKRGVDSFLEDGACVPECADLAPAVVTLVFV